MRNITFRQLRAVAAIARTGRVQAAATAMGVTAPAITQQLKDIESRVQLPLFERTRDGMRPTDAGRAIVEAAQRAEAALGNARAAIDALRGLGGGAVSVCTTSTAKYFAPAVLGAFRRTHPEIEIRLHVGNRAEAIRALAALEFDMGVMGEPPRHLGLVSSVIGDHPFVIVSSADNPLAHGRRITLAELADEHFLTREPGSGTRDLMNRIFADAMLFPRLAMEMASNETIKQAVMAGLGIAFLSAHTIAAEVVDGRLSVLDVEGLPVRRQWRMVRHIDKRPMPASQALWAFFAREGRRFLPTIP